MISAVEHLRIAQENAYRNRRYGFDFVDKEDESPASLAVRDAILGLSSTTMSLSDLPSNGLNPGRNLRHMAKTLHEDLRPKIPLQHLELWDQSVIGVLPTGLVNGCVYRKDERGKELDRYVICLNYGLMFGCFSLADALTMEILQEDLAQYGDDGSPAFRDAIERYLTPQKTGLRAIRGSSEWPPEVYARISKQAGALATIMFQFVVLHEFGHIVNGDVDSENGVRAFHAVANSVEYRREQSEAEKNWPCEFDADAYAIETLCDWKGGSSTCWPNFAQTYLLLGWFEHLEKMLGRSLCPFHPPAADRKLGVQRRAFALTESRPPVDYVEFIDGRIYAWSLPDP